MTDKERLGDFSSLPFEERIKLTKESIEKELKESDYYTPKNVCINTQYLLEIIEQAERMQELEELIDKADRHALRNGKEIMKLTDEKTMLEIENKRYREAFNNIMTLLKVTDTRQEYMDTVHDIIKDLEESK